MLEALAVARRSVRETPMLLEAGTHVTHVRFRNAHEHMNMMCAGCALQFLHPSHFAVLSSTSREHCGSFKNDKVQFSTQSPCS